MIEFEDFEHRLVQLGRFREEMESTRDALARANEWVEQNKIDVINVETVVLPNIHRRGEEGTEDPQLRTSVENCNEWYQFIRVWYRKPADAE